MDSMHMRWVTRFAIAVSGVAILFLFPVSKALAVTLTFDDAITGATAYSFDADSDGSADAIFSTTDPAGFNTVGPGSNMSYIEEPGLEGTTTLAPDLRVDFPVGAEGSLSFGFALSADSNSPTLGVTFSVYDAADSLLGSVTQVAAYTQPTPGVDSDFPEAVVNLSFSGIAAYAIFDFDDTDANRYIIDNFNGIFGSTERPPVGAAAIPAMGRLGMVIMSLLLLGAGMWQIYRPVRIGH